jgi:hypothetical protein
MAALLVQAVITAFLPIVFNVFVGPVPLIPRYQDPTQEATQSPTSTPVPTLTKLPSDAPPWATSPAATWVPGENCEPVEPTPMFGPTVTPGGGGGGGWGGAGVSYAGCRLLEEWRTDINGGGELLGFTDAWGTERTVSGISSSCSVSPTALDFDFMVDWLSGFGILAPGRDPYQLRGEISSTLGISTTSIPGAGVVTGTAQMVRGSNANCPPISSPGSTGEVILQVGEDMGVYTVTVTMSSWRECGNYGQNRVQSWVQSGNGAGGWDNVEYSNLPGSTAYLAPPTSDTWTYYLGGPGVQDGLFRLSCWTTGQTNQQGWSQCWLGVDDGSNVVTGTWNLASVHWYYYFCLDSPYTEDLWLTGGPTVEVDPHPGNYWSWLDGVLTPFALDWLDYYLYGMLQSCGGSERCIPSDDWIAIEELHLGNGCSRIDQAAQITGQTGEGEWGLGVWWADLYGDFPPELSYEADMEQHGDTTWLVVESCPTGEDCPEVLPPCPGGVGGRPPVVEIIEGGCFTLVPGINIDKQILFWHLEISTPDVELCVDFLRIHLVVFGFDFAVLLGLLAIAYAVTAVVSTFRG